MLRAHQAYKQKTSVSTSMVQPASMQWPPDFHDTHMPWIKNFFGIHKALYAYGRPSYAVVGKKFVFPPPKSCRSWYVPHSPEFAWGLQMWVVNLDWCRGGSPRAYIHPEFLLEINVVFFFWGGGGRPSNSQGDIKAVKWWWWNQFSDGGNRSTRRKTKSTCYARIWCNVRNLLNNKSGVTFVK